MVRAELKNGAPQNFFLKFGAEIVPLKKFFSGFGAEMAPSSLKMRPFQGGGWKRWYFGQICAPVTTPLRATAPQAPPLLRP